MGNFFRGKGDPLDPTRLIQGAAMVYIQPISGTVPTKIEDIIKTAAGGTQFDPVGTWVTVGFTKTGINITRNNAEEELTVDQIEGPIKRNPNDWSMSVGTQLEEMDLETFQLAWELGSITAIAASGTGSTATLAQRKLGYSAPKTYTRRQVAVAFLREDNLPRVHYFRRCERAAQESGLTYQPGGDQLSLPHRWNAVVDSTAPEAEAFGMMFDADVVVP
jgi:hypothetical protein